MANPVGDIVLLNSDFPRFKVVDDAPSDHHYLKHPLAAAGPNEPIRAKEEWRRLESGLPEAVFVRGYKSRSWLLRAGMVGAPGTPYHNFLFFFDILLPWSYPTHPPKIHYHSFKLDVVNPRLFYSGRVGLSLINTGLPHRWNHSIYLVQVLLAIHTLVDEVKPYFLTPAFSGNRGRAFYEMEAYRYNEKVYLRCCKLTVCLLHQPPMGFEPLVAAHFRERAVEILAACNKYRLASIGSFVEIADGLKIWVSGRYNYKGFVEDVYASLVDALFARYGELVEDFVAELAVERAVKEKKREAEAEEEVKKAKERAERSIGKRIDKLLVRLGLKKDKCGVLN